MQFVLILICVVYVITDAKTQEVKKKTFLDVQLVDAYYGSPVVFANVINQRRNWWSISDTSGYVKIPAYPGDTITVSSIGYGLSRYLITDSIINLAEPFVIMMFERVYELSRVDIHALGTYEDFKYRLLHMRVEDKMAGIKHRIKLGKEKIPYGDFTIPLGSPITFVYELFSKEAKSKRKLLDALEQENLIRYAEIKYNRFLVERVTGLKNEKLDEFILRYRPSLDYLLNATEYDIIGRIIQDFERYKNEELKREKTKNPSSQRG